MTTIQLSEREQRPDGSFTARVVFEHGGEYDVTVADPGDAAIERELEWYFEEHLTFPFLDQDRERGAVEQISAYGRKLFDQVFGDGAAHEYRGLRDRAFDGCQLEVTGSAGFHRLHWEALRDPELDAPLAVRLPMIRRVDNQPLRFALPGEKTTLNILVVTARPDGPDDVGYRTISRPLLTSLRQAQLAVTVDMVRPGTWEALRTQLERTTERRGSGWYHIVHFDLHGAYSDYQPLEQERQAGRLVFGPGPLPPFEGKQGFLFFETPKDGQAHLVPAGTVASLLAEHRVPMAVLNACQSAMQHGSEAGLAQQLVQAGVPVAVGMAYSVTVSAAERAMPVLYGRLAGGADPLAATHAARRELFTHRARQAYFDQQIELEDWMLPVVFRQRPLTLQLREMSDPEATEFYQRQATVGDEPATEYGFVGRDLDIQAIERRLLLEERANQLLVQGMAGSGKSTLLRHAGWWWQRTGLVDEVFRFSYEDRAWTTSQILGEISKVLYGPVDQARIQAMPDAAQLEKIAQRLRAERHLVILDNAESITASPAAIPHALADDERQRLATLLSRLQGGRTLVLIGSRESETWLAPHSFGDNIYPLAGLDPQATSILVERILRRHRGTHHLNDDAERSALRDLVALLGGYPLPLTVVLPVLATTPPSAVLTELQVGGASADPVGLIRRAIEYSHGKLDPTTQNSLLLLAPFTAVIPTGPALERYRDLLLEHEVVRALGSIDLPTAVREVVNVGLAIEHPELRNMIAVQPVLPYFLRSRLHDQPDLRTATHDAHYQLHSDLGGILHDMLLAKEPQPRATGQLATRAEYANLTSAVDYALRNGQSIQNLIKPLEEYLDQTKQQPARCQLLDAAIAAYPEPTTPQQQRELALLHNLAGVADLSLHRLDKAYTHYHKQLEILEMLNDRPSQGVVYHQLGRVAEEQRQFEEADANYRRALEILLGSDDRYSAASTYYQLGRVAQKRRQFEETVVNSRRALEIYQEFNDRYQMADIYVQLGAVADELGRFEEAEANYRRALEIYLEFEDRHRGAAAYQNLGVVAQERRRFEEAEANYRRALEIYLEFNDRHGAASSYHQLGMAAEERRRFEEAEANYRRALEIYLEFDDRHSAARTYHNLGGIDEEQRRLGEAEDNYRSALEIYLDTNDLRSASSSATRLGTVLAELNRHSDAVEVLLFATVSWRQESGNWAEEDLRMLKREGRAIGMAAFAAQVESKAPEDLVDELMTAIGRIEEE